MLGLEMSKADLCHLKLKVLIKTFNLDTKTWLYLEVALNDPFRGWGQDRM